jgi:hypothetical protein
MGCARRSSGYWCRVTNLVPSSSAVRRAYQEELGPGQRSALLSWLAFTGTFTGLRALTYSIRLGKGPFRNISVGGEHLHHYMWGIGLVSGVGAVAVRGEERQRRHPAVAVSYGAGLALIVDEFALLLDLKDVYWAKQGRISIDIGIGGIALAGSYFAALPVLRRLQRERKQKQKVVAPEAAAEVPGPGAAAAEAPEAAAEVPGPGAAAAEAPEPEVG